MPKKIVYARTHTVRLTEAMSDRVEALAEEDGRSVSDWLRAVVRRAIKAADKRRQREGSE